MRTRRKWLVVLFGSAATVAVLAWFNREQQPFYHGRPYSDWLEIANKSDWRDTSKGIRSGEAWEAIAHIGTNGLPYVLKWMEHKPSRLSSYLLRQRDSEYGRGWPIPLWATGYKQMYRGEIAPIAFDELGPDAAYVIPQLTALARNPDRELSFRGCCALQSIGPQAIPALVQILEDTNAPAISRSGATHSLSELVCLAKANGRFATTLGTNAGIAVLPLIRNLRDADESVAWSAAEALGTIGLEPEICVPALTSALQDPRVCERAEAALSKFKDRALTSVPDLLHAMKKGGIRSRGVIPALMDIQPDALRREQAALISALNDPDPIVQWEATNAVRVIAPYALTNAPP